MLIIIGSYRGKRYLKPALRSLNANLWGGLASHEVVIVDDSPDAATQRDVVALAAAYRVREVIPLAGQGYNVAMQSVVKRAGNDEFLFWEEDFTLIEPVDLGWMSSTLQERKHLAQLSLLRQPWFPIEVEAGGLIPGLVRRTGQTVELKNGIWEHHATFTCNPAVWRAGIAALGWPLGQWSEDAQTEELLQRGYAFGIVEGVKVLHDGVRSGHGY